MSTFIRNDTYIKILITRLSPLFGVQGRALNWFKSYNLSSCSFLVKCDNNFLLAYVVFFKGSYSVLRSIVDNLLISSTHISPISLNHHCYTVVALRHILS